MNNLRTCKNTPISIKLKEKQKGVITMPKISKEQINKINSKCSNGWQLDIEYYLYHGEKQLIKCIDLDEENYLKFTICYNSQNQMALYK